MCLRKGKQMEFKLPVPEFVLLGNRSKEGIPPGKPLLIESFFHMFIAKKNMLTLNKPNIKYKTYKYTKPHAIGVLLQNV